MNADDYLHRLRAGRITIVVDDEAAASAWSELGPVLPLTAYDRLAADAPPALLVTSRLATVGQLHDTWEDAAATFTVLWAARYDSGLQAQRYAAAHLQALDGAAALARRAWCYDALLTYPGCDIQTSAGALAVDLADELEIANTSDEVRPLWLQSITEFAEASIVNLESETSSFRASGTFAFAGLAHLVNTADVRDRHAATLTRLMRAAAGGDNHLELADNRVVRVVVGGSDVTAAFVAMFADDERGASALELGLGCAALTPDWTIDSPLHKCCAGAFIGVGTGHRGPHVDFVALAADPCFRALPTA